MYAALIPIDRTSSYWFEANPFAYTPAPIGSPLACIGTSADLSHIVHGKGCVGGPTLVRSMR
jgi:hypothetical protein